PSESLRIRDEQQRSCNPPAPRITRTGTDPPRGAGSSAAASRLDPGLRSLRFLLSHDLNRRERRQRRDIGCPFTFSVAVCKTSGCRSAFLRTQRRHDPCLSAKSVVSFVAIG